MGQFLPAAALALTAVGTGAGIASSASARRNTERAIAQQVATQRGFSDRAKPIVDKSIEDSGPESAQRFMDQGNRQADLAFANLPAVEGGFSPIQTDSITNARVNSQVGQQQDAQSITSGLRNWFANQNIRNQNVGNQLGIINTLSQGSSMNAPYLASMAGNQSANLAGIGSLLSTAGGLAGLYAATRPVQQPGMIAPGYEGFDSVTGVGDRVV